MVAPPERRRLSPPAPRRARGLALVILLVFLAAEGSDGTLEPATQLDPAEAVLAERAEDPVHFTVSVSGDILIHSFLWERALANGGGSYDFAPFFAQLDPYVADADLAICHVETPMTSAAPASYPLFNTPPELAKGIAASGWDACDTASNHALDQGQEGVDQTGAALDRAGIEHTCSFPSASAQRRPLVLDAKGIKVGYVAYTDFSIGFVPHPWSLNYVPAGGDIEDDARPILADAQRARDAGAEAVVVTMQWGDENSTEPNDSQLALADALTRSPLVTAVVGQGPHVVQPIRRLNGKFVAFSEGNLVSNQSAAAGLPAETQYGYVALLHLIADENGVRVQRVAYAPTWVRLSDYVVLPVGVGLRKDSSDAAALREAYDTVVGIAGRGKGIEPIPALLP